MTGLLDYIPGNSFFHKLNPLTKLFFSFLMCAACFISTSHFHILAILALNLLFSACSGVLKRSVTVLLSLVQFSLLLFVVQIVFVREGTPLLHWHFFLITDQGLSFSLLFVLRLITATLPLTFMLSITLMSDISNALTGMLKIPYKWTFALTTAIRFIPLFSAEMAGIMEAQIARGVAFDTKNFLKKIRLILPLCVTLLISSVRKIEGCAISAELRGFHLRTGKSGYKRYLFSSGDIIMIAASLGIAALELYLRLNSY
ncbi:ABC transporter permease [Spirochaetia bacterium]|nr:ABC transporter permease [Spirochaetia bacterium]